jgi:phage terminase small subunit
MLTSKQETFVLAYIRTGVASAAYVEAYNVAPDTKRKTVWEMASRLLNNPKVAARISELRERAAVTLNISLSDLALEFTQNRSHALDSGKFSAANVATRSKAKLFGYL